MGMQVPLRGKVPEPDACIRSNEIQFRIVQPVNLGVVILGRINDTPFVVLVNVGVQCNLLFCRNRSDSEPENY